MQILDTNPQLFFHLQQQRLIELIRNGKVEEALEFAQEELAPRGEENVMLWSFIYVCLLCLINHFCMILNTSSEKCNQPHQFFFTSKLYFGQKFFFFICLLCLINQEPLQYNVSITSVSMRMSELLQ